MRTGGWWRRDVEAIEIDEQFAARRVRRSAAVAHLAIGGMTIYNASLLMRMAPEGAEAGEHIVEAELPWPWDPNIARPQGVLTHTLVSALRATAAQCTYQQIMERCCSALEWLQPVMIGRMADARILGNLWRTSSSACCGAHRSTGRCSRRSACSRPGAPGLNAGKTAQRSAI